jgi:amino acid transporter
MITASPPGDTVRPASGGQPVAVEEPRGSTLSVRQAAFIGVASMVGAGIFSLLGAAGEVAGSAVWVSFILAGAVAVLQGYSFSKIGARYPSSGGLLEYVVRGYGNGHVTGVIAWLVLAVNAIITAMVAVSFGSYASAAIGADDPAFATRAFAALLILAMSILNSFGSQAVARVQSVVVVVVIGILSVFAVTTLASADFALLAPAGYPPLGDIVASVALTFFAFLGFGVITFTAAQLAEPARQLSRAVYLALGIATVIYVAVALGVFGTLTVDEVIESGGTALAVAAEPVLGQAGYWLMTVTALFATAGATNAGLYPAAGLCEHLASIGQFPPLLARRVGGRAPAGLIVTAVFSIILAVGFNLNAIASIGSAVALVIFALVGIGHMRIRQQTGASAPILVLGILAAVIVLVMFVPTLLEEQATIAALVFILVQSIVLDFIWKRVRGERPPTPSPAPAG